MLEKNRLYVGIDLGYERAMVSMFHGEMKEPETVSTIAGEERYQIPAAIFVGKQGNYFYGEEARKRENHEDGEFCDRLYWESLREENAFLYRDYLARFIGRLIKLKEKFGFGKMPCTVAVSVPEITPKAVQVLHYVRDKLEIAPDGFLIMDYGESFFAHTYHQDISIWQHDVALFDFTGNRIRTVLLHREMRGRIHQVGTLQKSWDVPGDVLADRRQLDAFFAEILLEAFVKRIVSGIYLIGDGFDGNWLNDSLRVIGPNKRVFLGKNLYTRGACLAAFRRDNHADWRFFYDAPYKMQGIIGIKLKKDGKPLILPLAEAGENWFDVGKRLCLLYDGEAELEVRVQKRGERYASARILEFEQLPERPKKTIRLALEVEPDSGKSIRLHFRDDGFGDIFPATKKEWDFTISMEE